MIYPIPLDTAKSWPRHISGGSSVTRSPLSFLQSQPSLRGTCHQGAHQNRVCEQIQEVQHKSHIIKWYICKVWFRCLHAATQIPPFGHQFTGCVSAPQSNCKCTTAHAHFGRLWWIILISYSHPSWNLRLVTGAFFLRQCVLHVFALALSICLGALALHFLSTDMHTSS